MRADVLERAGAGRVDIVVHGHRLVADSSGAVFCPAERTLLVADLHLEKGSSFGRAGVMLPPYDTRETLTRLGTVLAAYEPERIIALGDSFHDGDGPDRMHASDLRLLGAMTATCEWIWLTGNHDPVPPARFGHVHAQYRLGALTLRHEPVVGAAPEIAGHLHPAACVSVEGRRVRRPCFIGDAKRLVLPAFGAFTGGLNVLDRTFETLFEAGSAAVWMLGYRGLYAVPARLLRGD
jgi:DNA ligase-associated metallophosphoesterase